MVCLHRNYERCTESFAEVSWQYVNKTECNSLSKSLKKTAHEHLSTLSDWTWHNGSNCRQRIHKLGTFLKSERWAKVRYERYKPFKFDTQSIEFSTNPMTFTKTLLGIHFKIERFCIFHSESFFIFRIIERFRSKASEIVSLGWTILGFEA